MTNDVDLNKILSRRVVSPGKCAQYSYLSLYVVSQCWVNKFLALRTHVVCVILTMHPVCATC